METAMQLMLEDLELRYKVLYDAEMLQACAAIEGTIEYAKSLIIKEKEQIMTANIEGTEHGYKERTVFGLDARPYSKKRAEYYYNQTYNQNK